MTPIELRKALAAFLGDGRFKKFVAAGWRGGRLRFWQQSEWRRFCAARPELNAALADLEVALRICELHGDELQADEVELIHGCVDCARDYIEACKRLFPHAATDPVSTEGARTEGNRIGVWYCPSCRAARAKWTWQRTRARPGGAGG